MKVTERAFAAVLSSGSVVTWGDADYGGDSEHVQVPFQRRKRVQSVFAHSSAATTLRQGQGGGASITRVHVYVPEEASSAKQDVCTTISPQTQYTRECDAESCAM